MSLRLLVLALAACGSSQLAPVATAAPAATPATPRAPAPAPHPAAEPQAPATSDDFAAAFAAKELVHDGRVVKLVHWEYGPLVIASGRMIAFDPDIGVGEPFVRVVPKGKFWLQTIGAKDVESGLARVVFAQTRPTRWERAVTPNHADGPPYRDHFAFADARTVTPKAVDPDLPPSMSPPRLVFFEDARDPLPDGSKYVVFANSPFVDMRADWETDAIAWMWWGLDDAGNVVQLVADFGFGDFARPPLR